MRRKSNNKKKPIKLSSHKQTLNKAQYYSKVFKSMMSKVQNYYHPAYPLQSIMEQKMKIPSHIIEKRNQLEKKLIESGQMERLQQYLRKKLIASGWKENLKNYCKDLIREKGIERVTIQTLMEQLEMRGKHTIPVTIREDMLSRVRKFLQQNK